MSREGYAKVDQQPNFTRPPPSRKRKGIGGRSRFPVEGVSIFSDSKQDLGRAGGKYRDLAELGAEIKEVSSVRQIRGNLNQTCVVRKEGKPEKKSRHQP